MMHKSIEHRLGFQPLSRASSIGWDSSRPFLPLEAGLRLKLPPPQAEIVMAAVLV